MTGPVGFTINGATTGDQSGWSVKRAGDVNGDGIDDVIVGANYANPVVGSTRSDAGISYVLFGRSLSATGAASYANINLLPLNTAGSVLGFAILGANAGDQNGRAVSAAGDVNGDGLADVIVGANIAGTRVNAGMMYVIFGRSKSVDLAASYANIDLRPLNTAGSALGFAIFGAVASDFCGESVSAAGDVNGDGISDVIVGTVNADPVVSGGTARVNAGVSYVIFGRSKAANLANSYANVDLLPLHTAGSAMGFAIFGAAAADRSGRVSGAGDVNGDGLADVIVGASGAGDSSTRASAGMAYVIFGRSKYVDLANSYANIDLMTLNSAGSTLGFAIFGAVASSQCGESVSTAGDVNGDGLADVIVGASFGSPVVSGITRSNAGMSYVLFGRNQSTSAYANIDLLPLNSAGSTLGYAILGAVGVDQSGFPVSAAGDVNGDGVVDVLVGSNYASPVVSGSSRSSAGTTYVIFGRRYSAGNPTWYYTNIDLAVISPIIGFRILGAAVNDMSGYSISTAGDVNADGISDVIVGVRYHAGVGTSSGASYVIFGALSAPTSQPSSQPSRQPSRQPTGQPSAQPSRQPSGQPSRQPSSHPTCQPSSQPTSRPSTIPSRQPSGQPTTQPQSRPSTQPSTQPSRQPSGQPSTEPSRQPSSQPTSRPSGQPSVQPTLQPSSQPSVQPSAQPVLQPTSRPSVQPSSCPSTQPSAQPSVKPSSQPSSWPSHQPSTQPVSHPSSQPSTQPTVQPVARPSAAPSSAPSLQPSQQPSSIPSLQPSSEPSGQPSAAPSPQPSARPSVQPTQIPNAQPTAQPSSMPSVQPTAQPITAPSAVPTVQPSDAPSSQPTRQPSCVPSAQPSSRPSCQPFALPSSQPSCQPSQAPCASPSTPPSSQPTSQPTVAPSARPTMKHTGESATIASRAAILIYVAYVHDYLWSCGGSFNALTTTCVLVAPLTGSVETTYQLDWDYVTAVLNTSVVHSVVIVGKNTANFVTTSEVATCVKNQDQLHCATLSFYDATFLATSFVPYPNKLVHVGWSNVHTSITVTDVKTGLIQSYVYSATNIRALTLSQIQSPPNFLGSFVAGTAIRATAIPINYIVAGMFRTDGGNLRGMVLTPLSGDILNSVDLVNAMALEYVGPDSFIAGGLQLADVIRTHAYLLRANALFNTVSYCVRYISAAGGRRALRAAAAVPQSVVRGMVRVNDALFLMVDRINNDVSALTVLKTNIVGGIILQQVHVNPPNNTNFRCTGITVVGAYLSIVCAMQRNDSSLQSVMLVVDQTLSFTKLPVGFVRSEESIFQKENLAFQRIALSISQTPATLASSTYEFNTAGQTPTRQPSLAPSYVPTSLPTSAPSSQPSSSPTAAPSVSARPTSQPSSAVPTVTHRPSLEPTAAPSKKPNALPTVRPSFRPTVKPSAGPTAPPTVSPTVHPSASPTAQPTRRPSVQPTHLPTRDPTQVLTQVPSWAPTTLEDYMDPTRRAPNTPSFVVGASIGGGLGALLIGYLLYKVYEHYEEKKARALRKIDYMKKQALLAIQRDAEIAKYIQAEEDRNAAFRMQEEQEYADNQQRRQARKTKRSSGRDVIGGGEGAYATGPVMVPLLEPENAERAPSDRSIYSISTLHSSEMSSALYDATHYTTDEGEPAVVREGQHYTEEGSAVPSSGELSDFAESIIGLSDSHKSDSSSEISGEDAV